jgi:hypothetical protein
MRRIEIELPENGPAKISNDSIVEGVRITQTVQLVLEGYNTQLRPVEEDWPLSYRFASEDDESVGELVTFSDINQLTTWMNETYDSLRPEDAWEVSNPTPFKWNGHAFVRQADAHVVHVAPIESLPINTQRSGSYYNEDPLVLMDKQNNPIPFRKDLKIRFGDSTEATGYDIGLVLTQMFKTGPFLMRVPRPGLEEDWIGSMPNRANYYPSNRQNETGVWLSGVRNDMAKESPETVVVEVLNEN